MEYDFTKWDVDLIQDPNKLLKKLKELDIKNKTIKSIKTVGYCFNFEQMSPIFRDNESFSRYIQIDDPLIIGFEDGTKFEIDYSEGSTLKIGCNSLPDDIKSSVSEPNIDCNVMFSNCIGKEIIGYSVEITDDCYLGFDFTGSYGIELDENQDSYISCLKIHLSDQLTLNYTNYHDYGEVWVTDSYNHTSKIKWGELKTGYKKDI